MKHQCFAMVMILLLTNTLMASAAEPHKSEGFNIETHTEDAPADHPILNAMSDNPLIGDETQSIFIRHESVTTEYAEPNDFVLDDCASGSIILEPDQVYEFLSYCRNAADPDLGEAGIAYDVLAQFLYPSVLEAGIDEVYLACLTESGSNIGALSQVVIRSDENLQLKPLIDAVNFYDCEGRYIKTEQIPVANFDDSVMVLGGIGDVMPGIENSYFLGFRVHAIAANAVPTEDGSDGNSARHAQNDSGASSPNASVLWVIGGLIGIGLFAILMVFRKK